MPEISEVYHLKGKKGQLLLRLNSKEEEGEVWGTILGDHVRHHYHHLSLSFVIIIVIIIIIYHHHHTIIIMIRDVWRLSVHLVLTPVLPCLESPLFTLVRKTDIMFG